MASSIVLQPNQLRRFYRGGRRIASFRNSGVSDEYSPEEWIGSTTPVFGSDSVGVTVLPDGTPLPEAMAASPESYLGPAHVQRFGPDPHLLVKLLDAGERLPVHLHPDRSFAREHLGSEFGKTEAWAIVGAEPDAAVHVGFSRDVDKETLANWVEDQATESLLRALNRVPVSPGDVIFVPAGTPHAIGEGIFMVELQEPSDFSILLEWEGFAIDGPTEGHLGLGYDLALEAVDCSGWSERRLATLRAARPTEEARPGVEVLFPTEADGFFRAERIRSSRSALSAGFSLLVVLEGDGRLVEEEGDDVELARGDAVLVLHRAGTCHLDGGLEVLRCMPPDPAAA